MVARLLHERPALGATALVVLILVVYLPAVNGTFLWDDDEYITANPLVKSRDGLTAIWLDPSASPQYYPLTFTTLWLQYQLWGEAPLGYHLVNIGLHAVCALLLWRLLRRLAIPAPWLGAAVFGLHPVCVESVAWIAELKNVQSGALYLGCLLALLRVRPLDTSGEGKGRAGHSSWVLPLILFAAALLSKPAGVGLPILVLVLVWWKTGTVRAGDVRAVVPMLAMGLASGLATLQAERYFEWNAPILERALVAGRALWFYAAKLVWPAQLSTVYPRWEVSAAEPWQLFFPVAAAATLVTLGALRHRIGRGPLAAATGYAVMLAPALGMVDLGYFRYSFVADHFQYHAAPVLLSALVALAAGLAARLTWPQARVAFRVAAGLVLATLATLAWRHAHVFQSETARCRDTLSKNPHSWLAMNNLGVELAAVDKHWEAKTLYEDALRLLPDYAEAHNNLGASLAALGDAGGAELAFREAVRIRPDYAEARCNLGTSLVMRGVVDEAIPHLEHAVKLRPGYEKAHLSLASALASRGQTEEAAQHLAIVLDLNPHNATARAGLDLLRATPRARPADALQR